MFQRVSPWLNWPGKTDMPKMADATGCTSMAPPIAIPARNQRSTADQQPVFNPGHRGPVRGVAVARSRSAAAAPMAC